MHIAQFHRPSQELFYTLRKEELACLAIHQRHARHLMRARIIKFQQQAESKNSMVPEMLLDGVGPYILEDKNSCLEDKNSCCNNIFVTD